jgi:hypothetical protein
MTYPEPENPFFSKNQYTQKGFIQQYFLQLIGTIDTIIHFKLKGKEKDDLLRSHSVDVKIDGLKRNNMLDDDLYNDLKLINQIRNSWQKKIKPDEKKIRNKLNQIKCIWWDTDKRNKYSIYKLTFICIGQIITTLSNSPTYQEYWDELLKNAK